MMKPSERIARAIDEFVRYGGDIDVDSLVHIIKPEIAQLEAENEVLRKILWKCRHGGKGGIPVDYQAEVDALLQDTK